MTSWFSLCKVQAQQFRTLLISVLVMFALLLFADFFGRIWVPRDTAKVATFEQVESIQIQSADKLYSNQMQQWLNELSSRQESKATGSSGEAATKVLPGSTNLTTLRVRVRAVFLRQQPSVALALAELQTLSDGKVQLQRLEQGSKIDGYHVLSIKKGLVVFESDSDSKLQVSVPVFKGGNP
jgi:hypothetical protein